MLFVPIGVGVVAQLGTLRENWKPAAAIVVSTAQALLLGETAGAFAGLAIGVNGMVTAVVVPPLMGWIVG